MEQPSSLKALRKGAGLTQQEASAMLKVPYRTYKRYESDPAREGSIKYAYLLERLSSLLRVDEEHGILSLDDVKRIAKPILAARKVRYCYLFGSYSRGEAGESSDVDLLVSMPLDGLEFFALLGELREALHKKVDLLDISSLEGNFDLTKEILQDGIRIYG